MAKSKAKASPNSATTIQFLVSPEDNAHSAQKQRALAINLAARIEKGESISELQGSLFAASILREWAARLPDKPEGKQGPVPKIDAGAEALAYASLRTGATPLPHGAALEVIADRTGVSTVAINKAIAPYRELAFGHFRCIDPGNKTTTRRRR